MDDAVAPSEQPVALQEQAVDLNIPMEAPAAAVPEETTEVVVDVEEEM